MKRRTFLTSAFVGTGAVILPPQAPAATPTTGAAPLTVQTTEGPYYLALDLMRADITEGHAGIPLDIAFTVLEPDGRPSAGALVDVWHCDAAGNYSGFETQTGKTFLRGTQAAGKDGTVVFHSLYPGWYRGRTTHIHFKVRRGKLTNVTSQFFLPDALSEFLYTQTPAYRRQEVRDTLNSGDGIAIEAGATVLGNVREAEGRYVASLTVRVDPAANPPIDKPPVPGEGGMGMPPMDGKGPPNGAPPGGFPQGGQAGGPPSMQPLSGEARVAALLPTAKRNGQAAPGQMRPPTKG